MRKAKAFLPDIDKTFVFTRPQTAQPRKFRMLRPALAYLAVAVLAILLVTGLPFGGKTDLAASEVDVAEAGAWSRLTEWVRGTNPAGENPIEQPASTDLLAAPGQAPSAIPQEISLESLLASAVAAGQTPAQIDRLLNAAVGRGSVRVPTMLITTDGRVDTSVLIASIGRTGLDAPKEQGDSSSDESFVTPETAILDIQDMTYLVQPGDSLGGLALKFYGNPQFFYPIFDANREVLATPGSLRASQQLLIPSRSKL